MTDKIKSEASFLQKLKRRLRFRGAQKRRIALENLDAANDLTRQEGRLPAIREARDAYMSALYPVNKRKVGRAG